MRVVVPFAAAEPKTRLESVLGREERSAFATAMLRDVLAAIRATGREPTVLATASLSPDRERDGIADVAVTVDDRPLSDAVNAVLAEASEPVAVVMADLALATSAALEDLFDADADVAVAPGRGGGTNALVVRHPDFRVDYHGASYLDHRRRARNVGASVAVVDSFRLSTDVDEPADLVEVLLHGGERSRAALEAAGVSLETTEGRVTVDC